MVIIKRLAVMIGHEDRALQRFDQRVFADIHVGIVDEHTGIDIAVGVDVEVPAASGNAAAHIFGVILEVHGEERFAAS